VRHGWRGRDAITGLPDRVALLARFRGYGPWAGLLVVGVGELGRVAAALGHPAGERLVAAVAGRLRAELSPSDFLARVGEARFAVLVRSGPDAVIDRITGALERPVGLAELAVGVGASVGLAPAEPGDDGAELLRRAEAARRDAVRRAARCGRWTPELDDRDGRGRLALLADLRAALDGAGDELAVWYQPQVALATGAPVGVEALLRWHHPRHGLLSPAEVVPATEHSEVMPALTRRVLADVAAQLARWRAVRPSPRVSVNVSMRDLHRPELVDEVGGLLDRHTVPASLLQLEITEGSTVADPRRVLVALHRLEALGVALSLDDFGTGHASLRHLRRFPLSEVKIDKAFVLGMAAEPDDAAVVEAVVGLGRRLGLRVVAEGVEDERTRRLLVEVGCEVGQGWLFARPMQAAAVPGWLARHRGQGSRGGRPSRQRDGAGA
jgi:predicted signal transduction protein with EAL and GGDEF domain